MKGRDGQTGKGREREREDSHLPSPSSSSSFSLLLLLAPFFSSLLSIDLFVVLRRRNIFDRLRKCRTDSNAFGEHCRSGISRWTRRAHWLRERSAGKAAAAAGKRSGGAARTRHIIVTARRRRAIRMTTMKERRNGSEREAKWQ